VATAFLTTTEIRKTPQLIPENVTELLEERSKGGNICTDVLAQTVQSSMKEGLLGFRHSNEKKCHWWKEIDENTPVNPHAVEFSRMLAVNFQ